MFISSQITMKRRPVLYIVNFLLPVLFFLCLDLASFLISEKGGEKLSFKVTVLLAVTVLQLILNEILPASTNRIPLIGESGPAHPSAEPLLTHVPALTCLPQLFTASGTSP